MEIFHHPNFTYRFNSVLVQSCLELSPRHATKPSGGGPGRVNNGLLATESFGIFFVSLWIATFPLCFAVFTTLTTSPIAEDRKPQSRWYKLGNILGRWYYLVFLRTSISVSSYQLSVMLAYQILGHLSFFDLGYFFTLAQLWTTHMLFYSSGGVTKDAESSHRLTVVVLTLLLFMSISYRFIYGFDLASNRIMWQSPISMTLVIETCRAIGPTLYGLSTMGIRSPWEYILMHILCIVLLVYEGGYSLYKLGMEVLSLQKVRTPDSPTTESNGFGFGQLLALFVLAMQIVPLYIKLYTKPLLFENNLWDVAADKGKQYTLESMKLSTIGDYTYDSRALKHQDIVNRHLHYASNWSHFTYVLKTNFRSFLSTFAYFKTVKSSTVNIPHDLKEFKWTCGHCGRTFKETVRERIPGASDDWVNSLALSQRSAHKSSSSSTSSTQFVLNISTSIKLSILRLFKRSSTDRDDALSPKVSASSTEDDPPTNEKQYVLLNIRENRSTTRLVHNDVTTTYTDEELFRSLQTTYKSKKRWRWARINILSHIEWKQFHLYHSNLVATNPHSPEDWPQCTRPTCNSGCSLAQEYTYTPRPTPLDPPIPRQAFMHFLHHPHHAGTKKFHYNIIPKRQDQLHLGPEESYRAGWGLEFKEAVNWWLVAVIEGVIAVASLVFAIVWRAKGGNVQDAFAPSCWMLAVGGIVLTGLCWGE